MHFESSTDAVSITSDEGDDPARGGAGSQRDRLAGDDPQPRHRRGAGDRQACCRRWRDGWRSPPTKILLALLTLAALTGAASAQQRTIYDASGKVTGRSSTSSSGAATNYDARGRIVGRESTNGNQTTVYDARLRKVGRFT